MTNRELELEYFGRLVDDLTCTSATKAHIKELFRRYGYEYSFRSSTVTDIFGVKTPGGASAILRKLMNKYHLIESPQYGVYRFIKK